MYFTVLAYRYFLSLVTEYKMKWLLVEDVDSGEIVFSLSFCPFAPTKEEVLGNLQLFHNALIVAIHLILYPFKVN